MDAGPICYTPTTSRLAQFVLGVDAGVFRERELDAPLATA